MNNNDEHLSLGNLFRIIKDSSRSKVSALQSELFCTLFELEGINDTTVNNYCVGCRSIGSSYKQVYLNKEKRYSTNKDEFTDNIIGILSIIDGVVYNNIYDKITFINENESANIVARKLYNLGKNDKQVINEFTNKLSLLINDGKIYECLVEELLFVVLHKKQPVYEEELKVEVFEDVLNDTSISSIDLQEYLSLKLREGINFDYSMRSLADRGNAYANYEIGSNEYYGYFAGYPRYDEAFKYLDKAASMDHASANYMIGNMFVRGLLGNKSNEELEKGCEYLEKSYKLGNVAASNLIGNMYLNGIYPLNRDVEKAKEYYKKASDNNYAYAFNNLGRIEEDNKNYIEAFNYYLQSANLGESWACNKVAEAYRIGVVDKDMDKAYYYYTRALENNYRTLCFYAYYNLAKYFYMNGYDKYPKDVNKAIEYFNIASNNGILDATLELFFYYSKKYLSSRDDVDKELLLKYKVAIEGHNKYDDKLRERIEHTLNELSNKREINIDCLID
jgi:TPR repeat protein